MEDSTFSYSNSKSLFNAGYKDLFFGNDKRGNEIINYSFSLKDSISAEMYRSLSVLNTKNGNYELAIKALENAYKISPEKICGYYGWVLLYYYRDYEKALSILEECDNYTPEFSDAPVGEDIHYLKGLAYMGLKRYDNAIHEFDTYIYNISITHGEEYVDLYTYVQKGRCLTELGKFNQSILSYRKAISFSKNSPEAYYFMGLSQIHLNQKVNACSNLNKSLELLIIGYKSSDTYVEYFHEIYSQQIKDSIMNNCTI
jgi:tetratricopeptide (TPR) repeat protein